MSAPDVVIEKAGATVFGSNEGPTPPGKEEAHLVRSLNACVTRTGLVSPLAGDGMVALASPEQSQYPPGVPAAFR